MAGSAWVAHGQRSTAALFWPAPGLDAGIARHLQTYLSIMCMKYRPFPSEKPTLRERSSSSHPLPHANNDQGLNGYLTG